MSLAKRLASKARDLSSALILSSSLAVSGVGCEEMTDEQVVGILFETSAPYSKDPRAGAAIGSAGNALIRADAAQRSRSQVNVYNNQPRVQQPQRLTVNPDLNLMSFIKRTEQEKISIFRWADHNEDGQLHVEREVYLPTQDNRFFVDEGIFVITETPPLGTTSTLISFGEDIRSIRNIENDKNGHSYDFLYFNIGDIAKEFQNQGKVGTYDFILQDAKSGSTLGRRTFIIDPRSSK